MRYFVTIDGKEHTIEVSTRPGGGYDVSLAAPEGGTMGEAQSLECDVLSVGSTLTVRVAGRMFDLVLDGDLPKLDVFASGRRASVDVETARMRAAADVRARGGNTGNGLVTSPMPGKVVKVLVTEGDEVALGKPLVVVEAMKMENELIAEGAGVVKQIFVKPGDAVEGGARLIAIG